MIGWIKLHRQLTNHWVWQNSDYLKWWLDILIEVNHTNQKTLIKGMLFECMRGEKLYSLDTWAKRWGTNKSKVRRFLELLEKDEMIVLKNEIKTTRLSVCNYDSYQDERNASETQVKRKRNASETQTTPIQECNNNNNDKNEKENISFEVFWDLYNKKVGNKEKCIKKWNELDFETQNKIISFIPDFLKTITDKQYLPFPETFINQKRWNDIIQVKVEQTKKWVSPA